ncbi:type II toxin-antitoxin system RelB family antitoxin [Sphingobium phenoxybenzoativorans]|uniref:type II toxin-antitoxin system RelB family antitoxin n=1 Tax=Sphingobium phenoxybenzoativorans TaxID=1592790 RepID=UPI0009F3C995|nr:hypothetical protein [Sphingobium phenoxybenzoativorans]
MTKLSPIVSEFDTAEQAESHDHWVRAKVVESLADTRPSVPHDEVMKRIDKIIDAQRDADSRLAR